MSPAPAELAVELPKRSGAFILFPDTPDRLSIRWRDVTMIREEDPWVELRAGGLVYRVAHADPRAAARRARRVCSSSWGMKRRKSLSPRRRP